MKGFSGSGKQKRNGGVGDEGGDWGSSKGFVEANPARGWHLQGRMEELRAGEEIRILVRDLCG